MALFGKKKTADAALAEEAGAIEEQTVQEEPGAEPVTMPDATGIIEGGTVGPKERKKAMRADAKDKKKEAREARAQEQERARERKAREKAARKELKQKKKEITREGRAKQKTLSAQLAENEELLSDRAKQQAKRRRHAKDVYSALGFNLMYQDGTCEVEEGIFSQTIEFGDISYQSVSTENQREFVKMYSQIFDSCGSETTLQMNIVNTPLDKERIGTQEFFTAPDPELSPLVAEYNSILNRKMLEGVSNMTRRRFLTYTTSAESYEQALPRLARIRGDMLSALHKLGCKASQMDGVQRLEAIASQTRPGIPFNFDYDELLASGLTAKDYVCPTGLDFRPMGDNASFVQSGKHFQVLVIRQFGSQLSDTALSSIIDLPIPINVSLHVQAIDKGKSAEFVKTQLGWIDKEIVDFQQKAVQKGYSPDLLPQNLSFSKNEAEEVLAEIQYKNQRLFIFTGLVMTYADTPEELRERVIKIISTAKPQSIEIDELRCQQREGWNSSLPIGNNHVNVSRHVTTAQISIMVPFATQELNETGGGYYGQNRVSSNLILFNRRKLAAPMGFVLGLPGSGKSFAVKREVFNSYITNPKDEFLIIDPQGEYPPLVESLGGEVLRLSPSSEDHINIFDIYEGAWKVTGDKPELMKSESICALAAEVIGGGSGLTAEETTIIDRCVREVYGRFEYSTVAPTLGDFYEVLKTQPDPETDRLVRAFELYVEGGLNYFNSQTTVDINKRITCFSFKQLGNKMRVFAMLVILDFAYNRMLYNFERGVTTWLYIDEVQSLFSNPAVLSYFDKFWSEGRKYSLIPTGITQTVERIIEHDTAKFLLSNSDFLLLLRQSDRDRMSLANILRLSEQQQEYIGRSIDPGDGLLIAGSTIVPFTDDFPHGKLYDLWNTKPDEVAEQKQAAWQRLKSEEYKEEKAAIERRRTEVRAAREAVEKASAVKAPVVEVLPAEEVDNEPEEPKHAHPLVPVREVTVTCPVCGKTVPQSESVMFPDGNRSCADCAVIIEGIMAEMQQEQATA